jgi:hypothetical protein
MGWGLVIVLVLTITPMIYRNLMWKQLNAFVVPDVSFDQFRMQDGKFQGLDSKGNPFKISIKTAWQTFENPDIIFAETVHANIVRIQDGVKITDDITAKNAEMNQKTGILMLTGDVHIVSSNGDVVDTQKLNIKLTE